MVAVQPRLQIVEWMFFCVTRDQVAPGVQWRSGNPDELWQADDADALGAIAPTVAASASAGIAAVIASLLMSFISPIIIDGQIVSEPFATVPLSGRDSQRSALSEH